MLCHLIVSPFLLNWVLASVNLIKLGSNSRWRVLCIKNLISILGAALFVFPIFMTPALDEPPLVDYWQANRLFIATIMIFRIPRQ